MRRIQVGKKSFFICIVGFIGIIQKLKKVALLIG